MIRGKQLTVCWHVDDLKISHVDSKEKGKVKLSMIEYLKETIQDFSEEITGCVATPAADHLFNVNPDGVKLDETMARKFHTSVAKLQFVYKQARHYIQTAVASLTTR
eukprot:4815525-Ditylum_brightwellii.AAC.1